jgi:quercetin dioxygenase-like cupin family protein
MKEVDKPWIITPEQTQHLERAGFSAEVYVGSHEQLGFNALKVIVETHHSRKRIETGNTRIYHVMAGEGIFELNDTAQAVAKGDTIVIPAGGEYAYQGRMVLFEVNVSPDNSFRDTRLE